MLGGVFAEGGEQLFVAGGIRGSQVVHRLNQPHAEEVGPHPVDDRPGEVRILWRRQPAGERFATVARIGDRERCAVERSRWLGPAGARLQEVAPGLHEHRSLAVAATGIAPPALPTDPREHVGKRVILVVGPLLERMVVAFRAADRERHERLAHVLRHGLRILMHGEEVGRAVLQARTLGRYHLPHEPVPRRVLRDAVADPLVVGVYGVGPQLRSAHEQDVRPLVGPVVDELRPRQEQVDETFPFAGRAVGQVASDLLGRR